MRPLMLISLLFLSACGGPENAGPSSGAGAAALAACSACHSLAADGPRRSGPTLAGVVGRPAGTIADFRYSAAMTSSKLVWDNATLEAFLADPRAMVPGTKMTQRVSDAAQRRDIVEALKAL